jgi:hypothetical protein
MRVGSEAECLGDFQSCRTSTDVELVHRSEVGRSQGGTIQTCRVQGGTDGRYKSPGAAVKPRNLVHRVIVAPRCSDVDETTLTREGGLFADWDRDLSSAVAPALHLSPALEHRVTV